MKPGIYMITGCAYPPTDHGDNAYGGKSLDLERRFEEHQRDLRKGNHHNNHLQNYYNKHGEGSLKFVIIRECGEHELDDAETKWIEDNKTYENKNAFNQTPGGDGGVTHTLEFGFENTETGEIVFGDNIAAFCRMHPELNKDCMYRVHRGKQECHKGWIKKTKSEHDGAGEPNRSPDFE